MPYEDAPRTATTPPDGEDCTMLSPLLYNGHNWACVDCGRQYTSLVDALKHLDEAHPPVE